MSESKYYDKALLHFYHHYHRRLENVSISTSSSEGGCKVGGITSTDLKKGNEPRIYLHPERRDHIVVLTHGLSDSPYYMEEVGRRFFAAGANVILPLLPGHGLVDPDEAMEDYKLDAKWREEIDNAVITAGLLGDIISLGGFSTGGALSYNKILREAHLIKGGLFLFSAAIDVRLISTLGQSAFVAAIVQQTDGTIKGQGMDPYKYPKLPMFAALELGQIISQNEELGGAIKISQPVFAAHSIQDDTAKIEAINDLLKHHTDIGTLFTIAQGVQHAEVPLLRDIPIDPNFSDGKAPKANPQFEMMMDACIAFFNRYVLDITEVR